MQAALVDTGPLAAWFNADDPDHSIAQEFFRDYRGALVTTWAIVTEVTHLLRPEAQVKFLAWVRADGVRVEGIQSGALESIERLIARYANLPMDFADATLVALAEATGIGEVITFDSRGFGAYRFRGKGRFVNLMPQVRGRRRGQRP